MKHIGLILATAAAGMISAAVHAEVTPPPGQGTQWQKGHSEWNMPPGYVPGDPLQLTTDNMNAGPRVTFVACPYIRDSEPTPLWFSEFNGETYFLRAQQNGSAAVTHPQLRHRVLVEGVVSSEPRIGGGVVLSPLYISVIRDMDESCNKVLPADGSKVAFAKRGPGPGGDGLAHRESSAGRRAAAEQLWSVDYKPAAVERKAKEVFVPFHYNFSLVYAYQTVVDAVRYARDVGAGKIEILGTRASVKLSDGQTLVERAGIEKERAQAVAAIFADFPIAQDIISVNWDSQVRPADGVSDFANRFVSIKITPAERAPAVADVRPGTDAVPAGRTRP